MTDLPRLSYSQLASFDRCELQHYLRYIEGWQPKKKPERLIVGNAIHQGLEVYYKEAAAQRASYLEENDALRVLEVFIKGLPSETEEDLDAALACFRILKRYFLEFSPTVDRDLEILQIEEKHTVTLETEPSNKPFTMVLIPDRIVRDKHSKTIWLLETKTTANASFWDDLRIMLDVQTTTYLASLREKLALDIHGILYDFVNRYQYKRDYEKVPLEKLFRRIPTYRSEQELDNVLDYTRKLADRQFRQVGKVPLRSLQPNCTDCDFYNPCLLGLKGHDMRVPLESGYEKRERYDGSS